MRMRRFLTIGLVLASALVVGATTTSASETVGGGTWAGGVRATRLGADPYVIVFDRAARGRERLFAVRPDGSAPRPLTKAFATSRKLSIKWSHDRSKLAFTSLGRGSPLWVMNANGTGPKLLVRDAANVTWSPDDKRLVFVEDDRKDPWLNVINVDGSGRRSLVPGQGPEWSADGRIYFERGGVRGWRSGTFSINPDADDERRFAVDFDVAFLRPSPDGKQIAFVGDFGTSGLYVVRPDGTGLRRITPPVNVQDFAWAPGSDRVAFLTNDGRAPGRSYFALGVAGVDGTGLRYLAHLRCCGSLFSWSPDGTRIAFDAAYRRPKPNGDEYADVNVVNAGGGRVVRVTRRLRPRGDNKDPTWVPASHLRYGASRAST
jgi:Tol biopolymer transport system component